MPTLLAPNEHLKGFDEVTRHIHTVTPDQDATFIPTGVSGALYNYCPVTSALKEMVSSVGEEEGRRMAADSDQECAVIPFAPDSLSTSKNGPEYRFIAMREVLRGAEGDTAAQRLLFLDDGDARPSPLHPTRLRGQVYKIFALVTNNLELAPEAIVRWYHARCGKSEPAGGHVVTKALGANAAWWQMTVLSANLLSLLKRVCLPESCRGSRPKKLRYCLFSTVARVSRHARRRWLAIYHSFSAALFETAWNRLARSGLQTE